MQHHFLFYFEKQQDFEAFALPKGYKANPSPPSTQPSTPTHAAAETLSLPGLLCSHSAASHRTLRPTASRSHFPTPLRDLWSTGRGRSLTDLPLRFARARAIPVADAKVNRDAHAQDQEVRCTFYVDAKYGDGRRTFGLRSASEEESLDWIVNFNTHVQEVDKIEQEAKQHEEERDMSGALDVVRASTLACSASCLLVSALSLLLLLSVLFLLSLLLLSSMLFLPFLPFLLLLAAL